MEYLPARAATAPIPPPPAAAIRAKQASRAASGGLLRIVQHRRLLAPTADASAHAKAGVQLLAHGRGKCFVAAGPVAAVGVV
jgi:hypothetical protein